MTNTKSESVFSCLHFITNGAMRMEHIFFYFQLKLTVLAVKLCHQYSITEDEGIRDKARNLLSSTLQKYAITQRQKAINAQHVRLRNSF